MVKSAIEARHVRKCLLARKRKDQHASTETGDPDRHGGRCDGQRQRLGDHAARGRPTRPLSALRMRRGSCPRIARPTTPSSTRRAPPPMGSRASLPARAGRRILPACSLRRPCCRYLACRFRRSTCAARTLCCRRCRCPRVFRSRPSRSARRARQTPPCSPSRCSRETTRRSPASLPTSAPGRPRQCGRMTLPPPKK